MSRRARAVALGCALAAAALPFLLSPYEVSQLTLVAIYAVAILGLNLLTGYTGQLSLAQSAFFAVGAYVAAILIDRDVVTGLAVVPAGAVVAGVAGLLLGLPAVRIRGLYLALVTLAVAVAVPPVVKRADGLTGGASGLNVEPLAAPSWSGLADDQYLYLVALAALLAGLWAARRITTGVSGRALMSVRDDELSAAVNGIPVARVKVQVFGLSAGYAGAAGALYTLAIGFVSPESFTLLFAFTLVTGMVVGGPATLLGAVVGALFVEYVPVYAGEIDESLVGFTYGAALLVVIYAMPDGIAGTAGRIRRRLQTVRRHPQATAVPGAPAVAPPTALEGSSTGGEQR